MSPDELTNVLWVWLYFSCKLRSTLCTETLAGTLGGSMQRCKHSDHHLLSYSDPQTQHYRALSSVIRDTFNVISKWDDGFPTLFVEAVLIKAASFLQKCLGDSSHHLLHPLVTPMSSRPGQPHTVTFMLIPQQRARVWDFNDLNINVTVKDAHGEGSSCQNFSSRWEFLSFLREQIDQIQDSRIKLEQRVAALRRDVDEARQKNAEERELKELLQLHVEAERRMTENILIGDVEDQQRWAGRQERGNELRIRRAGWWHEGLNPVSGEEETVS
ncbi:MAG: hypothetical protein Q9205_004013 [Flavoplaca limonia]